jgi:Protein of unknown function (DUF3800)
LRPAGYCYGDNMPRRPTGPQGSSTLTTPPHYYVAYIDEAGDDGLDSVKPIDEDGASEWLIVGAMLIPAASEQYVQQWHQFALNELKSHQLKNIHFVDLADWRKKRICEIMADLNARYFVLASNKKNMKGHQNPFAAIIPVKNWFYCWLTRLLLERVTHFVAEDSLKRYGGHRHLKLQYSNRGGLSGPQMNAYYEWLKYKATAGKQHLRLGELRHEVLHRQLLEVYNHNEKLGLQFADVVASAFLKACDTFVSGGCDPQYAKLLEPRMGRYPNVPDGKISGYGLKLMPGFKDAKLTKPQEEIFRFYGYPIQWWAPAPSAP